MAESLRAIPTELTAVPAAILCVSAHWEEPAFTVQSHPHPPMLYDYGGFPEHTYRVTYPAPGSPPLARQVRDLLAGSGMPAAEDPQRGFDHGAFVPLAVAWPQADVPVVQLSLHDSLDPALHLAAGRALAPLRAEGVLILGSGFSFHNLRLMFSEEAREPSRRFDEWLNATMLAPPAQRSARLADWASAPSARVAHPREEHLLPAMVAVGAAEEEPAVRTYGEDLFGTVRVSSFRFGEP
jgi:aromatic ring-opening dioxygenase catalytic subunit (LigB family)